VPLQAVLESAFSLPNPLPLGHRTPQEGWRVQQGSEAATILPVVTRQGYNGDIHLLVAINQSGQLTGVRVTHHQETPGLGDDIERSRSAWITSFNGLSLESLPPSGWAVSKEGGEFDSFTGATITPRAVINAVYEALRYYQRELIQQEPAP